MAAGKRLVLPPALRAAAERARMSPAVAANGLMFFTGVTAAAPDGSMPAGAAAQMRAILDKIATVLDAAGLDLDAVVEMTSYHIGLRDHFAAVDAVRLERFAAPYPAWTAVEAAGLRREGALIEMRVVSLAPAD